MHPPDVPWNIAAHLGDLRHPRPRAHDEVTGSKRLTARKFHRKTAVRSLLRAHHLHVLTDGQSEIPRVALEPSHDFLSPHELLGVAVLARIRRQDVVAI